MCLHSHVYIDIPMTLVCVLAAPFTKQFKSSQFG